MRYKQEWRRWRGWCWRWRWFTALSAQVCESLANGLSAATLLETVKILMHSARALFLDFFGMTSCIVTALLKKAVTLNGNLLGGTVTGSIA